MQPGSDHIAAAMSRPQSPITQSERSIKQSGTTGGTSKDVHISSSISTDERGKLREGPTGTGGDVLKSAFGFPLNHDITHIKNDKNVDTNESITQAEDVSLADQKERDATEVVTLSHSKTPFRPLEDIAGSSIGQLRDGEETEPNTEPEIELAGDKKTILEHNDPPTELNLRYGHAQERMLDEEQQVIIDKLQNVTHVELEDMLNDPSFIDGPQISVRDRRGVYRRLGGNAAALRNQQHKTLCDICKGMNILTLTCSGEYLHARDHEALMKSANHCRLCHILSCATVRIFVTTTVKHGQIAIGIESGGLVGEESLHMVVNVPEYGVDALIMSLVPLNTEFGDPALSWGIPPIRRMENSGSPEAMRLLAYWLEGCLSKHCCQRLVNTPLQSPSLSQQAARLLDVSYFKGSEDVRVVETASMPQMPQYIAVSHVWGPSGIPDHTKLLTSNIEQLLDRMAYTSLAANFRDAVKITRLLGFRYIWIDALCIIQDSSQDWRTESMKMASVYMNAILTIAIDGSQDSDGGCFRRVDLDKSLPEQLRLESTFPNGMPTTLIIPEIIDATKGGDLDTGPKALQRSALSTRAWAYQERILSPRIIHFTDDGLIWECRNEYQGLWNILTRFTVNRVISGTDKKTLFNRWYLEIVPEYSGRNLTYDKDKLLALAGLSRLFHELLKLPYFAGIWIDVDDIGSALSWMPVCPYLFDWDNKWRRRNDSRCPSWSWASMGCGAKYHIPVQMCVANEETRNGSEGLLAKPRVVDYGCLFPSRDNEESWIIAQNSVDGWWDTPYALPIDLFGRIDNAWLKIEGWVRGVTIVDKKLSRGLRTVLTEDGVDVGTIHLDIVFHGNADVLLLCLCDDGEFMNALVLIEIRRNQYARLGIGFGLVGSKTGTRIEGWELKTIFVI